MLRYIIVLSSLFGGIAQAQTYNDWESYVGAHRYSCPGPFADLATPRTISLGGKQYLHSGYRMRVQTHDADKRIVFGVLGAIKDSAPATLVNIKESIAWFRHKGVEWVIGNGDVVGNELDADAVLTALGETGMPTLLIVGNSDSTAGFSRAIQKASVRYPNLVSGVWVRQLELDDAEIWTLPGYHDRRFVHGTGSCVYKNEDLHDMKRKLEPLGSEPVVLVGHGPPRAHGNVGVDQLYDGTHVGDASINKLISARHIPFGIFGHILESGGTAVGGEMHTSIKPDVLSDKLYVNVGSVAGDAWKMRDGSLSWGMATVVTIDHGKGKFEVKRFRARDTAED